MPITALCRYNCPVLIVPKPGQARTNPLIFVICKVTAKNGGLLIILKVSDGWDMAPADEYLLLVFGFTVVWILRHSKMLTIFKPYDCCISRSLNVYGID